jgi:hypothetical protein
MRQLLIEDTTLRVTLTCFDKDELVEETRSIEDAINYKKPLYRSITNHIEVYSLNELPPKVLKTFRKLTTTCRTIDIEIEVSSTLIDALLEDVTLVDWTTGTFYDMTEIYNIIYNAEIIKPETRKIRIYTYLDLSVEVVDYMNNHPETSVIVYNDEGDEDD